jgi:chromosome segregation ATPase
MHHGTTLLIPLLASLSLTWGARADDRETIEKLEKENIELRKQLDRERDVAKLNQLKARLADDIAAKHREEAAKLASELEAAAQKSRDQLVEAEKRFKLYVEKQQALTKQLGDIDKKLEELNANHEKAVAEIALMRKERDILVKQSDNARAALLEAQKELNLERRRSTENRIDADSFKQKAERMQARIVELEKIIATELAEIPNAKRNPAKLDRLEDVRGEVRAVTSDGLMVVISLGSDAGIKMGHEVFIYRPGKDPKDARYLGKVKIAKTEPKQSVGQFTPAPNEKTRPETGDVATTVERKR